MRRIANFYGSIIGKKAIVAVTGLMMFGFLILHVIGNLKGFLPPNSEGETDIDVYAHFLTIMGEPLIPDMVVLWTVRIVLIAAIVLHVVTVIQLASRNRAARPVGYKRHAHSAASLPARGMLVSGALILFFLIIHLLQFTTGTIDPTPIVYGCVYSNLYHAFQVWWILLFYIVAMSMVGLHVFHGVWSAFQTLSIDNPDRNRWLRGFSTGAAAFLFLAFLSLPTWMYFDGNHFDKASHPDTYSEQCAASDGKVN